MSDKYLITAALLYANGTLHFGHLAGAYLPADCFARFKRLKGDDVLFICGSDEYGIAITLSADLANRTPKEHVDIYHAINKELFKRLNISFDHYSRTTWEGHVEPTQRFFTELLENGYIEDRITEQLYSEEEGRFLADRYVVGTCPVCKRDNARGDECPHCGASYEATDLISPRSKLNNSVLIKKPTKNWFLRFDLFKDKLEKWLQDKPWKSNVLNFAGHYIKDLKPRAITRDSDWGVKIPLEGTEGKVLYVWFDAPIGYISATMEWAKLCKTPERWKDYWLDPKTTLVNFIGKDNIPFHAIFFPAMCMGQNTPYKLVDELPANEFLNLEGKQFSKSSGWTIDLPEFLDQFSADQIRYTLAANAPEGSDSEFSWLDFKMRCNSELVGKLGNFINRTLVFAQKNCHGQVPKKGPLSDDDAIFLDKLKTLISEAKEAYNGFHLRRASQTLMEVAALGNVYFDMQKPWMKAKDPSLVEAMDTTIYCCIQCIKALALISYPIIPEGATKIASMLNISDLTAYTWDEIASMPVESGKSLPAPTIIFQKIEDSVIEEQIAKLHGLKTT